MLLKLAASKVKSVTSTILINHHLHNANLAAILSVLVRLIENQLTKFFSVNRLTVNIPSLKSTFQSEYIILPRYTGGRYPSTPKPERNAFYSKIVFHLLKIFRGAGPRGTTPLQIDMNGTVHMRNNHAIWNKKDPNYKTLASHNKICKSKTLVHQRQSLSVTRSWIKHCSHRVGRPGLEKT